MGSLYEIKNEFRELYSLLIDEGADPEIVADTLEALKGELEVKAMGCIHVLKTLEMEEKAAKAEADFFKAKADVRKNNIKRLKNAIKEALLASGEKELKVGEAYTLKVQKNGGLAPLIITGDVPQTYTKVVIENDNERIREALNNGEKLSFAHLEERGTRLVIK